MSPLFLAILLCVIALGLALLDILVPSGGILLVLCAAAALGSILFGFRSGTTEGMVILTIVIGAIPALFILTLKVWEHTPIGKRIILRTPKHAAADAGREPDPLTGLVGKVGVVQNSLLPTGHVRIEHRNYNATALGEIIEAGQFVEVIEVRQRNLVVQATRRRPEDSKTPSQEKTSEEANSGNLLDLPADQLGLDSIDG